MDADRPDSSLNSLKRLDVGNYAGGRLRSMMFFDLGLIPNNAIINSATLRLYRNGLGDFVSKELDFHAILESWAATVTWNTRPPSSSAYIRRAVTAPSSQYKSFDIKPIVDMWVSGEMTNNGLMIKDSTETYDQWVSFDGFGSSNEPELIIDYTIPSTGKKCVEYVGNGGIKYVNQVNITPDLPTNIQPGDLLVAQIMNNASNSGLYTAPAGWTFITNIQGNRQKAAAYKFATANETAPTFSNTIGSSTAQGAVIHAFRNVKAIKHAVYNDYTGYSYTFTPSTVPVSTDSPRSMFVILNVAAGSSLSWNPPLGYTEGLDGANMYSFQEIHRYMHRGLSQTSAEMTSSVSASNAVTGFSQLLILEPFTNKPPTLTLTTPADNLSLTEGNTLQIEGSATDSDNGNVVTIKYKINNSTPRALQSGVSNGSTPISFAKSLTYSNKRLWDGSTDVTGVDLAENTDHTLTVWVEDDQGGKSAEVTRNFQVIWNRPPTISGQNDSLGTITDRPTITYSAVDPEGNTFTFTEYLNGQQVRSFTGEAGQEYTFQLTHDAWIRLDLDVPHQAKIVATDSAGMSSERVYTFTRTETHIEFMLDYDNPDVQAFFTVDGMPKRILVTLERYLPPGSSIESVRVTNNYLDAQPTWEDATGAVIGGRGYLFTNTTKTADNWAVCVWVTIAKGSADQRVHVYGYGGAFD